MRKDNETYLVHLTIEDLIDLLKENFPILTQSNQQPESVKEVEEPSFTGRLVYGIVGIERLFGVSHKTAQEWKDSWLQPAVKQRGRKIVTDVSYAMKLFEQNQKKKKRI